MANTIQHKRSNTPSSIPGSSSLSYGELAINYTDGKIYTKNNSDNIINLAASSISGIDISPANITAISFSGAGTGLTGTASSLTSGFVTNGVYTVNPQTISGVKTFADRVVSTSGPLYIYGSSQPIGNIHLENNNFNFISFNASGVGSPSVFSRTLGTKIILSPQPAPSTTDMSIGVETNGLWFAVPSSSYNTKFYAGQVAIATLTGAGNFTLNSASSAINASSAYFGGVNIGGYLAGGAVGSLQIWSDVDDLIFSADDGGIYSVGSLYADGNIRFIPETSSTLYLNGQVSFERVSNTQLKIKMRGTDGTTRSTTLTLS